MMVVGKRTRTILAQQFANQGQVVIEVPFDPHLRPGGVIDVSREMNPKTRRRRAESTRMAFGVHPAGDTTQPCTAGFTRIGKAA
jgi:hypothetical protein